MISTLLGTDVADLYELDAPSTGVHLRHANEVEFTFMKRQWETHQRAKCTTDTAPEYVHTLRMMSVVIGVLAQYPAIASVALMRTSLTHSAHVQHATYLNLMVKARSLVLLQWDV